MPTDKNLKSPAVLRQAASLRKVYGRNWLSLGLSTLSVIGMVGLFFYHFAHGQGEVGPATQNRYSLHIPIHLETVEATNPLSQELSREENNSEATGPQPCSELTTKAAFGRFTKSEVDDLALHALKGVMASLTEPRVLVTWSHDSIYLSVDDGKHFGSVLSPPSELIGSPWSS